jgi:hypothetical protein
MRECEEIMCVRVMCEIKGVSDGENKTEKVYQNNIKTKSRESS